MAENNLCECGSELIKANCCLPYLSGIAQAETALALMRSRYTAYVMANEQYLMDTWHVSKRPQMLNLNRSTIDWQGLEIIRTQGGKAGDQRGVVEFVARFLESGVSGEIHEISRFVFENGRWFYLDGDLKTGAKIARNASCPCGSGKKYKRCCGQ